MCFTARDVGDVFNQEVDVRTVLPINRAAMTLRFRAVHSTTVISRCLVGSWILSIRLPDEHSLYLMSIDNTPPIAPSARRQPNNALFVGLAGEETVIGRNLGRQEIRITRHS